MHEGRQPREDYVILDFVTTKGISFHGKQIISRKIRNTIRESEEWACWRRQIQMTASKVTF